jgi:hypothetical protein
MARHGLFTLLCGWLLIAGAPLCGHAQPAEDIDSAVAATLAVQNAFQQGREHLLRGDARAAVLALESQLSRINGNPAYLSLLRDAYRVYVKELRLARRDAEAQLYQQRLLILDPGAVLDSGLPAAQPAAAAGAKPATPARPATTVRGVREEERPAAPRNERKETARNLLARAEEEFNHQRYLEAGLLYEQAHQADPDCTIASRERWAYCRYRRVVEQINQTTASSPAWAELEREVRQTMELAPRLDYGNYLLAEIHKRRGVSGNTPAAAADTPVSVRHFERGSDGWARAETTNFRIFHNQPRELAEQIAAVAERTRAAMAQKWLGKALAAWEPPCDIYLHATAQDYSKATRAPTNSPGHSSIGTEGARVVSRRIHLHADEPSLLTAALPREATHVVLAGQFGEQPLPRWADTGMAVLSEPRDRVERHLRNLSRCRQDGELFTVRQLMQLNDYPDARHITAFFAQSVSLVEFLTARGGAQVFAQFLADGMRGGYEIALQKHYGFKGFDDLQQRWSQEALAGGAASGVAQARP